MGSTSDKRENNKYVGHPSIPEVVSDKLYNSIVKIKTQITYGTGFFIKLEKNDIQKFLFTCCNSKFN